MAKIDTFTRHRNARVTLLLPFKSVHEVPIKGASKDMTAEAATRHRAPAQDGFERWR